MQLYNYRHNHRMKIHKMALTFLSFVHFHCNRRKILAQQKREIRQKAN